MSDRLAEQYPMLRELSDITGGADAELDETNMVYGMGFMDNYVTLVDFIMAILDCGIGVSEEDIEFSYGFVAKEIIATREIDIWSEAQLEFRAANFRLTGGFPTSGLPEKLEKIKEFMENPGLVESFIYDPDCDYVFLEVRAATTEAAEDPGMVCDGEEES